MAEYNDELGMDAQDDLLIEGGELERAYKAGRITHDEYTRRMDRLHERARNEYYNN